MLATMRKALKKGLLQAVVWITLLSMILAYSGGDIVGFIQRMFGLESYVVSVNGVNVSKESFAQKEQESKQRIESIRQQFGPYADLILASSDLPTNPQQLAITEIVQEFLLNGLAHKLNIKLDPQYVRQSLIRQLPREALNEDGTVNAEALRYLLKSTNVADFEQRFEESLERNLIFDFVQGGIVVPSFEVNDRYNALYAPRKYDISTFSFNKFLANAKKITLPEDEVKNFYATNKARYMAPEKRAATVWEFASSSYGLPVSKADIEAYYNKNKATEFLKEPARVQARRILLTVNQGEENSKVRQQALQLHADLTKNPSLFADYAKRYSADKKTALTGGLLDFVGKGQMEPALEEALFALEKDGQVSDPIETEEGIELIQRVARKSPTFKTLDQVEADVRKNLETRKFNASFNIDAKRIIRSAQGNMDTLRDFAQQKNVRSKVVDLAIDPKSPLAKKVFSLLKVNDFGYFLDGSTGFIVQLNNVEKAHLPAYDKIKETIKEDLYKKNAYEAMVSAMEKVKSSSASAQNLQESLGVTSTITPFIYSESKTELEKLQKQGIPVQQMLELWQQGATKSLMGKLDGYVISVSAVQLPQEDAAKKREVAKNLFVERKGAFERGFIASLEKTAKIKVNIDQVDKKPKHTR